MMRRQAFLWVVVAGMVGCSGGTGGTGGGSGGSGGSSGGSANGGGSAGGGAAGSGGSTGGASGQRYEPLKVDARWTYAWTEPTADGGMSTGTKSVRVEAQEAVPSKPNVMGFRLRSDTGKEIQLTWQEDLADRSVRHRDATFSYDGGALTEESYAPYHVRVVEMATPATFSETFVDTVTDKVTNMTSTSSKTKNWQVVATGESVTVPAGTFSCLHLRKLNSNMQVDKDYWFARGVGKVKETSSAGRVESLTQFQVP